MLSEPVVGKSFFGRDEFLQLLDKRVETLKDGYRQNVAITGQCMTGKSSLLQHFLYTVRDDTFIPIYVEIGKESFSSFARKFIATLLYNSLKAHGDDTGGAIDELLEKAQRFLPNTAAAIRQITAQIERKQMAEAYAGLLGLTSSLREETKKSCIVILDEFHNMESFDLKNPFSAFGKVIMLQKDTMYIVSSSRMNTIRKILQEKLALLFGNFEVIELKGFNDKTASFYLDQRVHPFHLNQRSKKFLIALTGGNPFYLDCICAQVKHIARARSCDVLDTSLIEEAALHHIYASNGTIHQYLLNFLLDSLDLRHRDSYIAVLVAIANGANTRSEAARRLRRNSGEVSRMLNKLLDIGLLSKQGVFYAVEDRMLRFWLSHVYYKKQTLLINYVAERTKAYRKDLQDYEVSFSRDAEKDIIARIVELFDLFSNDLIQQEDKTILLPQFTKVCLGTFDDIKPHIVANAKNKRWICQIYDTVIDEDDVADCVRNMKSSPQKITKFVVVPLAGMDENAKLLAKELKIAIWDMDFINTLLFLYGKNPIVVL